MAVKFSAAAPSKPKQPTIADVKPGDFFSTGYGTVYVLGQDGNFIKIGNPEKPGRNFVTVKSKDYFAGRQSEAVTIHPNAYVSLGS
jgi:hypothetical protein